MKYPYNYTSTRGIQFVFILDTDSVLSISLGWLKMGNKFTKQQCAISWLLFIKTIQFKLGVHSLDLGIIPKSIHHPTQVMGEQLCP